MKKFKTNEEYVLNDLYQVQQELEFANKRIKELEEQLVKPQNNDEDMNCIWLSEKPNYFYCVEVTSAYNWNKILKDNKKTPKFVEEALKDEKKLNRLFDLKDNKDGWSSYHISKVDERIYNYLLKKEEVIMHVLWGDGDIELYQIKDQNFLDKEQAEEYRKKKVIETAQYYLKHYVQEFDKENK